jgi:hypothetical protein
MRLPPAPRAPAEGMRRVHVFSQVRSHVKMFQNASAAVPTGICRGTKLSEDWHATWSHICDGGMHANGMTTVSWERKQHTHRHATYQHQQQNSCYLGTCGYDLLVMGYSSTQHTVLRSTLCL